MFIDRARIRVIAGSGGSGACSFARFKFKPRGGPDGGDGGGGGSVYVRGDGNLTTLLDYRYRATWKAERGQHGKGKKMTGRSGEDLHLPVPPGTVIRDVDTGQTIGEVLRDERARSDPGEVRHLESIEKRGARTRCRGRRGRTPPSCTSATSSRARTSSSSSASLRMICM